MFGLFKRKEPETIEILGKPFSCHVCDNNNFYRREGQLNTFLATFFGFDWANRSAVCFVCSKCRYIHWFLS
jgi:hypothetical protein